MIKSSKLREFTTNLQKPTGGKRPISHRETTKRNKEIADEYWRTQQEDMRRRIAILDRKIYEQYIHNYLFTWSC